MSNQKIQLILDVTDGFVKPGFLDTMGRAVFVDEFGKQFQLAEPEPPPKAVVSLHLRGPILGEDEQGDGIRSASIVAQLQAIPQGVDEIHFWIDSQGGDFQATREIIDAMSARTELKIGHVQNIAYSGGFLIFVACDERIVGPDAKLMMHAVHQGGCIAETGLLTELCAGFIHSRCPKISRTTARSWLNRNNSDGDGVWMGHLEAFELGIATSVYFSGKPSPEIPTSLRPFKPTCGNVGECQCAECRTFRARAHRQPIDVPALPRASAGGFIIASVADFKPQAVASPQDAVREALRREAAGRFKEFTQKQERRIRAMAQG